MLCLRKNMNIRSQRFRKVSKPLKMPYNIGHTTKRKPSSNIRKTFNVNAADGVSRTLVPPDLKPILDVIDDGIAKIDTDITLLVDIVGSEMQTSTTNISDNIKSGVRDELTTANTTFNNEFKIIFDRNVALIQELVFQTSNTENTESAEMIETQKTALLQSISALITTAQTNISTILVDDFNEELSDLTTLITNGNMNVYDQISSIINDPNNTDPVIPQLTFLDPVTVADSIIPGKNILKQDIEAVLQQLYTSISSEIERITQIKLDEERTIMQTHTTTLVQGLNDARDTVLQEVNILIQNQTTSTIASITTLLTTQNGELKTQYHNSVETLRTNTATVIRDVTQLEIEALLPIIRAYNRQIADQVVVPQPTL